MYGEGYEVAATLAATPEAAAGAAAAKPATQEYEVFLSFRASDTRDGFTDFLYTYLHGAGVRTFRDDNELRVGEKIGPELLRAIKGSKISIPIFSKDYASSKWCLDELAQIWDCHTSDQGQMIFPIFYDVDPDIVKHQIGSYEEAFRKHRERGFDENIVERWEKTLTEVGRLKGLELKKETSGREGELVKVVVQKVLLALKKNYTHVPENLVGMEHHEEEMKRLLEVESSGVRIVGIHGTGGLGKTTIAKVIYNQLCERFKHCCFLDDVRDKSEHDKDIVHLQNQLLSKIQNREVPSFVDFDKGKDMIKNAVRGKEVLLVLDNVDRNFQIDKLLGSHHWFGDKSRIIITTRNKDVLDTIEKTCRTEGVIEVYKSYKPKLLNNDCAIHLFCKHAFMRDSPPEGYDILAKKFVAIAANLPLVLVTLGSSLFVEDDKDVWWAKLKKLENVPDDEVIKKLRFSFEALKYEEKQIFLDIACIFNGVNKQEPCYMWDACDFYPRVGISILVRRSLITIGDDDTLIMHDSLRDLGKQIIREECLSELGKRSRLHGKEAAQVLEEHQGTKNVKVLSVRYSDIEDFEKRCPRPCLVGQDFGRLHTLRYLSMNSIELDGDFKNLLQNLRWLRWRGCSGNCVPTNFYLKNLVILDLYWSRITDEWGGWSQIKMARKLKVLILTHCSKLSRAPHLSAFTTLERLRLDECDMLSRLDGLEELESLKYLNAACCPTLESLPDLSKLTKLQTLKLKLCKKLTAIQGLDKLESLEHLDISSCYSLERLPNLSNLEKLTRFDCSRCTKLVEIQGLHELVSLEHLDMNNMKCMERLSDLSKLKWLRILNISSCGKLIEIQCLDGLDSLEHLDMSNCSSIERLPDLSNLKRLKKLKMSLCDKLFEIQGLDGLESLEKLYMSGWQSLKRLPDLSNLRKLKHLNINSLASLSLESSKALANMPGLRIFKNLKKLNIYTAKGLTEIQGLEELKSLESLRINRCTSIEKLPNFSSLTRLREIDVSGCVKLSEIQGLEELKSLRVLKMSGCKSIENLPNFSSLTKLRRIDVSGCVKLTEIQGLKELKFLEDLNNDGCESLEDLQNFSDTEIQNDYEDKGSDYQDEDPAESLDPLSSDESD